MVILRCDVHGCDFQTPDHAAAGAAAVLSSHIINHQIALQQAQAQPQVAAATRHAPKLERPKLKANATNEEWNMFNRRWSTYRTGSNITDDMATMQLLECCTDELRDIVLRAHPSFSTKPIADALTLLKAIAVVPVALGVLRSELTSMYQGADEKFRTFAARVQGKAETCEFITPYEGTCGHCQHQYNGNTYYTTEYIRDVLLNGITDTDIRREALSVTDMPSKSINDIIAFVETRETARDANKPLGVNAFSSYRTVQQHPRQPPRSSQNPQPSQADRDKTSNCPTCNQPFLIYSRSSRGWNKKPHTHCIDCWRKNLAASKNGKDTAENSLLNLTEQFGQISSVTVEPVEPDNSTITNDSVPMDNLTMNTIADATVNSTEQPPAAPQTHRRRRRRHRPRRRNKSTREATPISAKLPSSTPDVTRAEVESTVTSLTSTADQKRRRLKPKVVLSHHIFTKGEWRRARVTKHPSTKLRLSPEHDTKTATDVDGLADSGAQADVWSLDAYRKAGYSPDDLSPVAMSLNSANKSAIHIDGAFFTTISGTTSTGAIITCKSMVYVSRDVHGFYLSYSTMLNLGMLSTEFPTPGCARNPSASDVASNQAISSDPTTQPAPQPTPGNDCSNCKPSDGKTCREDVPLITELPFPCIPENNARMKEWLLEKFSKSTFCKCPHHPIPTMSGPPLEIHLKDNAKPYRRHKANPIPVHWQQKVYDDLLRDEALGVIERVPYGEPVEWCHRMVLTRKHDGTPRRTVDLSPLNKQCSRETHNSESPFHVARRIPANTYKTVTDVWNRYHLVELRESDRHLTTFATPYGLWRYKRAIQGFVSSGDPFNRRFDAILAGFERKERVVDDTCHHDTDLETHWWRTIELLTVAGKSGVIFNPEKFQFAQREIDFAGFRVSDNQIDPLPKYFSAIRDFPTPTSTTDIRSWFGLVNQVANYAQLRDIMAPFRPFLSDKQTFQWNDELEEAFQASKEAIVDAIREGVEIFDPNRRTCLRADWSKKGIGYFLFQKHCSCSSQLPGCCPSGWRITLAGSRFLQSAEGRYAPVEGEALAVAWALEQTRYFTQGCDDLVVVTDHKPLVKLLGDRTLDEIANTRLFRSKQRTLP